MPRLEVLGRERVDDRNNLVAQRQKQVEMQQNGEYKTGMLKYYAENLKLQAKQTEDEVQKTKLQQKAAKFDYMAKVMGEALKSSDPQKALMTGMQMFPDDFHDILGDPDFNERVKQLQPPGEERMKGAVADLIQQRMGGTGSPNASQANAVGGGTSGVLIPKMNVGGMDIVFPEDAAAAAANEKRAGNIEDMTKEAAPGLALIDKLEEMYGTAFATHPKKGIPIQAGLSSTIGAIRQTDTPAANYLQTKDAFLSRVVRALGEKGVLTQQDVERVKKALPTQFTSKDLATANFQAIRDIISSGIQEYQMYGPAVGNVRAGKPSGATTGKKLSVGTPKRKFQMEILGE